MPVSNVRDGITGFNPGFKVIVGRGLKLSVLFTVLFDIGGCSRPSTWKREEDISRESMDAALKYQEFAEGDGNYLLQQSQNLSRVDHNSRIVVNIDKPLMAEIIGKVKPVSHAEQLRFKAYVETEEREADYIGAAADLQISIAKDENKVKRDQLSSEYLEADRQLQAAIKHLIEARDAAEAETERSGNEVSLDDIITNTGINTVKLKSLLNDEGKVFAARIKTYNEDVRAVSDSNKYGINVQAFIQGEKQPAQIHVQNYDHLGEKGLPKSPIANQPPPAATDSPKSAANTKASFATLRPLQMKLAAINERLNGISNISESSPKKSSPKPVSFSLAEPLSFHADTAIAGDKMVQYSNDNSIPSNYTDLLTPAINLKDKSKEATSKPDDVVSPTFKLLDTAQDGNIYLSHQPVDRGDVVEVVTTLYSMPATAKPAKDATKPGDDVNDKTKGTQDATEIGQTGHDLKIDRLGPSFSFSADLIFVNEFGAVSPAKGQPAQHMHDFIPAPSGSITFHYRPRWKNQEFWTDCYDLVDPGIGLNVAALHFESDIEIGLAIQLSLVRDIIKLGYGYDLMAKNRPQYWYVGIGFFETLTELQKMAKGQSDLLK